MKIFITGLTSTRLGGMEYHNLGNYIIMEPFIEELQREFPDAKIVTSIQMSDSFCERYKIISLRKERFWLYGYRTVYKTTVDLLRILLWKALKVLRYDCRKILRSSDLLSELDKADLVVDFSGDIYGDNASTRSFLECNARLAFAMAMNKPTVMLIGSPGPFRKTWRLIVAKTIMSRLDLITNREPVSTEFLEYIGIRGNHVVSTACPSVLFRKDESDLASDVLKNESLIPKRKITVGLIVCGWNMKEGPFDKWPRNNHEYEPFINLIAHLTENLNFRVCIMSHQNSTDENHNLIRGNDHRIINQLLGIIGQKYNEEELFTLKGLYSASMSKTIIGQLDLLISGRIHGAVQGLSQGIPTAIIDYGHEPKAHKLKGFARVYGVEDYICDPADSANMIEIAGKLWNRREVIRLQLENQVPRVIELARSNFSLTRKIYDDRVNKEHSCEDICNDTPFPKKSHLRQ